MIIGLNLSSEAVIGKLIQNKPMRRKVTIMNYQKNILYFALILIQLITMACQAVPEKPSSVLEVANLRCEYQRFPQGIDVDKPRLSWIVQSDQCGQCQTAYRVLVASCREKLAAGQGDLWDSGKVKSDRTFQVVYSGKTLKSGMGCFWKVKIWGKDGKSSGWSKPAMWTMGLMSPEQWQASWIYSGKASPELEEAYYEKDPAPLFRKTFSLNKEIDSATLHISGLGYFESWINGRRVTQNVLEPLWTDYRKRIFYSTYDVREQLVKGDNAIGVMLGNGWFNLLPLRMWGSKIFRHHLPSGAPILIARLEITYADGTQQVITTDRSWKWSDGPLVRNSIYLGEEYDARLEKEGWNCADYDDSSWSQARETTAPGPLMASSAPPIRIGKTLAPVKITEPEKGVYVFDFGQNFAGWVRLKVTGAAGTRVEMRIGELLQKKGRVNLLTSTAGQIKRKGVGGPGAPDVAIQKNVYILKGSENGETYTPRFTYHGFRYVEVHGLPAKPTADTLQGLQLHCDVEPVGSFKCSSELLNQIQTMTEWTFLSNLFGVQSDCPHREKLGYGGDIVATTEAFMLNYNMDSFYCKTVRDFADATRPTGAFTETAPFVGIADAGYGDGSGPPGWAFAHPLLLRDLYCYYGDKRLLAEQYLAAKKWLEFMIAREPDLIVDTGLSDHESLVAKPTPVSGTAFFYQGAVIVSRIAGILENNTDAERYRQLTERIQETFCARYLKEDGTVYNGTQASQALALYYDLIPEQACRKVFDKLIQRLKQDRMHLTCGIFGTRAVLGVLTEYERCDIAYEIVTAEGFPGWHHMLDNGATTLWEHWAFSDNTYSHNHPMFGSVSEWFYKSLAGIQPDPDTQCFKKFVIKPAVVDGLDWVKGHYHSPCGRIVSQWRRDGDRLTMKVRIPINTSATVYIPMDDVSSMTESGRSLEDVSEVKIIEKRNGYAVCRVESGFYIFESKLNL